MLYRLAHYEIEEEIGHGGMGVVYRAHDTKLGRPVAIKILPSLLRGDPERRGRFLREARAAAKLNHPNIATVYEVNEARLEPVGRAAAGAPECLYIAMEFIAGQDLHDVLADGPVPVAEVVEYGLQVADALDLAHKSGIVHRDLKPRNIRITPDGRVKILDFGLAKVLQEETRIEVARGESVRTAEGMIVGTVPYMAPEQVDGGVVDARSDLFTFGVVLYQMATGELPFEGPSLVKFVQALAKSKPAAMRLRNPEVPKALEAVVEKLLARDVERRYASASEVRRDLRTLVGSGSTTLVDSRIGTAARGGSPSWLRSKALRGGLVALALAVVAIVAWRWGGAERSVVADPRSVSVVTAAPDSVAPTALCTEVGALVVNRLVDHHFTVVEGEAGPAGAGVEIGVQCLVREDAEQVFVRLKERATGWVFWSDEPLVVFESGRALPQEIAYRAVRALGEFVRFRERHGEVERGSDRVRALNRFAFGQQLLERFNDPRELSQAVEVFRQTIEIDPGFAEAHAALSMALWRQARQARDPSLREEAAAESQLAVDLAPELPSVRIAKAKALRMGGDPAAAQAELESLVESDPENADVHLELAYTHWQRGDFDRARDRFHTAIRRRGEHWRFHNELGLFLISQGDFEGARSSYEQAVARLPEEVFWPIENLGNIEIFEGNFDAALAAYSRIPAELTTASLAANRATAYYYLGNWDDAIAANRQAVSLAPANPVFRNNFGDSLWMAGQRDEAVSQYEEVERHLVTVLESEPDHPMFKSLHSPVLAKLGRCEEALERLARLQREPRPTESNPLTYLFHQARAMALCDSRERVLAIVSRLGEMGLPQTELRRSVEFQGFADDAEIAALFPPDG